MRVSRANEAPIRGDGGFVLYWMTAQRRSRYNPALEHAVRLCNELGKPLFVLEALRVDYPWATQRCHRFVIDGMRANRERFTAAGATYFPYVEPHRGAGSGLVAALADHACAIVTDTYPCFFLRGLPERIGPRLPVQLEAVDGCGLLPLAASERVFTTAHSFRRHMQKIVARHLEDLPAEEPLRQLEHKRSDLLPLGVESRWPAAPDGWLSPCNALDELPIDHAVSAVSLQGGEESARQALHAFLDQLSSYTDRNHPDEDATSGLSPWLHFGHVSTFEVLTALADREAWRPDQLAPKASGSREGFWGMSAEAEAFLDQVVTWREVGFNMCFHRDDYDAYASLPDWSKKTLADHAHDERPYLYELDELDAARTHDPIWNAAQRELVRDGVMHNYMRMLWGKKILQWSPSPRDALARMIELNNRYALDGRDPNSYSGIFWVLGRYDRAWGPERPIFGKVRYMTSESARRKLRLRGYIDKFSDD